MAIPLPIPPLSTPLVPPPTPPLTPPLSLRLFGPLTVHRSGQPLPKTRSRKELWLLALLALHSDAPLERTWLAGTLWPEADDAAALYNLRRSLRLLRDALGPEASRLLSPTPRSLRLHLAGADCDAAAFDAALRRGDPASLREAAMLYQNPLLMDCREEWVYAEREQREQAVLGVLETLASDAQKRGDLPGAAADLERVRAIDPLRETAVRRLMEVHAGQGRHAAAADAYHRFRRRLRDELNAEPDPATVALHHRLRAAVRQAVPTAAAPALAAKTSAARYSSLPAPLSALIGREQETEAVAALLDGARLVTLTGTGGVGKTRLALAAARHLEEEFEQGAWFADLAPLADPKLMVQAVLGALGAREAPGRSPSEALSEFLRSKHLLLVLDNCEHLLAACSHLAHALLPLCPGLHLLATSREALGAPGEVVWRVPSLPVSGPDAEAVQLFTARARSVRPDWVPSLPETHAITEICRRLDGIPLAIEMAAARTRSLPVESIISRLGQTFRLLPGPGGAGGVPRQQTLRATLDWSWDLLADEERTLLSRVSVFSGGWELDAAEAVCMGGGSDEWAVLDGLTSLVDKSLVVYAQEDGRYRLLETIRQYASEKRQAGEEAEAKHAAYFLALAEEAEPEMMKENQARWLTRLETEHDNLRAALLWQGQHAPPEQVRLAGALWRFWKIRGHSSEGRRWLTEALVRDLADTAARAKALTGAGSLAWYQSDYEAARALYQEGLALSRRRGDEQGTAVSLASLGNVALGYCDYAGARTLYEESLAIQRRTGHQEGLANTLNNLGIVALSQGHHAQARELGEESLALRRRLGDKQKIAASLSNLGNVAFKQGDWEAARALCEESLAIQRLLSDREGIAGSLNNLGNLAYAQGRMAESEELYGQSVVLQRQIGHQEGVAVSLINLGNARLGQGSSDTAHALYREGLAIYRRLGDKCGSANGVEGISEIMLRRRKPAQSARLLGAAAFLREINGCPLTGAEQADVEQRVIAIREALGVDAFAAAWAEGQAMDWEQAADYALNDSD